MQRLILDKTKAAVVVVVLAMSVSVGGCVSSDWRNKLARELPVLGHRNWIIIADSAYPAQSRGGIETIATGAEQIQVVKALLKAVDDAEHVRATVYVDEEMKYVSEKDAPGIDAYREELTVLLEKQAVKQVPHEKLIAKLDEAAKTFRILIFKSSWIADTGARGRSGNCAKQSDGRGNSLPRIKYTGQKIGTHCLISAIRVFSTTKSKRQFILD
jgi:L-fucose mutarotase/ribose pyranase (RbsD/FucU family)